MPTKTVDKDVIENLKNLGGQELLVELFDVFISSSQKLIVDINQAINQNNAKALQDNAHSLKSSCGNMGAAVMAELCLKLEKMGQANDLAQAQATAELLGHEFKNVEAELKALIFHD